MPRKNKKKTKKSNPETVDNGVGNISVNKGKTIKIVLNGMFKNEAHIIHEMLTSVEHLVDGYCMVDTGSSDDTIKIVNDFFQERQIPGIVHEKPWYDNYGKNRTENMTLAHQWIEQNQKENEVWYICIMDADDRLVDHSIDREEADKGEILNPLTKVDKQQLWANYVSLDTYCGASYMYRPILLRDDAIVRWRWYLPRHEYVGLCNKELKFYKQHITEIYLLARSRGDRSKDPVAKVGDARSIQRWLREVKPGHEDYNEPDYSRMIFYLAQSYKDLGLYEEAERWYIKRVEFAGAGNYEELYMGYYNAASCRILIDDNHLVNQYLRKAIALDHNRLEARFALVRRLCEIQHYNEAYGVGASFMDNHVEAKAYIIQVDLQIYQWLFDHQCALALFYAVDCGPDTWRYRKCLQVWQRILDNKDQYIIATDQIEMVQNNVQHCVTRLAKSTVPKVPGVGRISTPTGSEDDTQGNMEAGSPGDTKCKTEE